MCVTYALLSLSLDPHEQFLTVLAHRGLLVIVFAERMGHLEQQRATYTLTHNTGTTTPSYLYTDVPVGINP